MIVGPAGLPQIRIGRPAMARIQLLIVGPDGRYDAVFAEVLAPIERAAAEWARLLPLVARGVTRLAVEWA